MKGIRPYGGEESVTFPRLDRLEKLRRILIPVQRIDIDFGIVDKGGESGIIEELWR